MPATAASLLSWEARPRAEAFSAPSCAVRRGVAAPTMGRRALLCFCGRPDPGPKLFQHRAAPFAAGSRLPQWLLWEARPRAEAFSAPSCAVRRGVAAPTMGRRALLCFFLWEARPRGEAFFCTELRHSPRGRGSHNGATCTALFLWEARPRGEAFFCTELRHSPRGRGFHNGATCTALFLWEARPRGEAFFAPSCAIRRGVAAPTMGRRALLCFCGRPAPGGKLFLRRAAPFAAGWRFPQWLRRALLCSCGRPAPGPKLFCTELHRSPRGRGSHNGATCTALFSRKTRRRMHKVPGRLHFGTGRAGVAHQTSCA